MRRCCLCSGNIDFPPPPPPPPFALLLNHEARNINGLIIPAESEIKDVPCFFLLQLPNRWRSYPTSPGNRWRCFCYCGHRIQEDGSPACFIVTGARADTRNLLILSAPPDDDRPHVRGPSWLLSAVVLITKTSSRSQVPLPTQVNCRRVVQR